jgi:L-fucose isomerase-like protein
MSNTVGPNRWLGSLPKIGIRPAIDGRFQGVRESLEEPTMALAKAVADLLTANLRHPNGQAVECVIADTNIGGVAEAAACAEKFARAGVGLSITVTPCWCYGSETMDMDPLIPKAVWGLTEQNALAQSTWRLCWLHTTRRDCPPSPSMVTTLRIPGIRTSPKM